MIDSRFLHNPFLALVVDVDHVLQPLTVRSPRLGGA